MGADSNISTGFQSERAFPLTYILSDTPFLFFYGVINESRFKWFFICIRTGPHQSCRFIRAHDYTNDIIWAQATRYKHKHKNIKNNKTQWQNFLILSILRLWVVKQFDDLQLWQRQEDGTFVAWWPASIWTICHQI